VIGAGYTSGLSIGDFTGDLRPDVLAARTIHYYEDTSEGAELVLLDNTTQRIGLGCAWGSQRRR